MDMTVKDYNTLSRKLAPRSHVAVDCAKAFAVGGSICALGQLLLFGGEALGLGEKESALVCTLALILLSALLTGFGLYDKIAKHAGAGTLVPITGFANAITAPAIEFKTEGYVLGLGAKMFTIAGPVIVYGVAASIIYGMIYWVLTTML